MFAAVIHETGGPEVLTYEELPDPTPSAHELLIDVVAISLEGGDLLHRQGASRAPVPGGTHVVGYQCAGIVTEVGAAVEGFAVGDRVTTVGLDGSHATKRAVLAAATWKVPEALSLEDAAAVPVPFGTAHDGLFEFGRLQAGETVLIQAGASGVGIAAIQLAAQAGARVLATASSPQRLEPLYALGLDEGIDYVASAFPDVVRQLTEGRGVDLVLDTVGGPVLAGSLASLAYRGRCVSIGDAGRHGGDLQDLSVLRGQNQTLIGYFMGAELFMSPRVHGVVADCLDALAAGTLQVVLDRRFPLAEAAAAHAYVESRQAIGRVLLVPET